MSAKKQLFATARNPGPTERNHAFSSLFPKSLLFSFPGHGGRHGTGIRTHTAAAECDRPGARTKRIFGRLRDGWAYDEIGRDEGLSAERVRQIVSEVLGKRVIDRNEDHAHLQLERLGPALRLAGEAVQRGEVKAIGPLIKVLDRLDKHQVVFVSKYHYGDEEREKLHAKINRIAANLKNEDPPEGTDQAAAGDAASQGEKANEFFIGRSSPVNP
jgi:hypothetical protein